MAVTAQGFISIPVNQKNALNITAAKVVKASKGYVKQVIVLTAGSTGGTVSDVATTGGVAAANLIFNVPDTVGVYTLDMPFQTGLVVVPGTGQVLAVSYA